MAPPGALPWPPAPVLRPCPCTARRHAQIEHPQRGAPYRRAPCRTARRESVERGPLCGEPKSGDALQSVGQTGTAGGNVVSLPTVVGHSGGTLAGDRAVAAGEEARIEGTPLRPASGRRRIHRRPPPLPPPPRRCRRRPGGGGCRQRSGVSRSHAGDGTDGMVPRSPLRIKSHGPPIRTGQARQNFPALSGLKAITAFPFFGRTATVAAPAILGGGVGHRRPNQRIARRSRPRPVDFRPPAPNPAAPFGARTLPRPSETSGMTGAPGRPIWARASARASPQRQREGGAGTRPRIRLCRRRYGKHPGRQRQKQLPPLHGAFGSLLNRSFRCPS